MTILYVVVFGDNLIGNILTYAYILVLSCLTTL